MNEQQIKMFCKLAIEKSKHSFTDIEKELLKLAVDKSKNWDELIAVAFTTLLKQ